MTKLTPVHPGEILTEEFLAPLGITNNQCAIDPGVSASRIDQIARGKAPMALLLHQKQSTVEKARLPEIKRQVRMRVVRDRVVT